MPPIRRAVGLAVPIWPLTSLVISPTFPPFVSNKRMRAWTHAQQPVFSEGRGRLAYFCKMAWQLVTSRMWALPIGCFSLGRWPCVAKCQAQAENPRNSRCHGNSAFTRLLRYFRYSDWATLAFTPVSDWMSKNWAASFLYFSSLL